MRFGIVFLSFLAACDAVPKIDHQPDSTTLQAAYPEIIPLDPQKSAGFEVQSYTKEQDILAQQGDALMQKTKQPAPLDTVDTARVEALQKKADALRKQ